MAKISAQDIVTDQTLDEDPAFASESSHAGDEVIVDDGVPEEEPRGSSEKDEKPTSKRATRK